MQDLTHNKNNVTVICPDIIENPSINVNVDVNVDVSASVIFCNIVFH